MALALHCQKVTHGFGSKRVLHEVELRVPRGQFVSLVGPSGCGKSTLLRAIIGTHLPNQGEVHIWRGESTQGQPVTGPGRDRGIVYQHYSLFPFLTARENVAVGLMLDQTGLVLRTLLWPRWRRIRKEHLASAQHMLERVRLSDAGNLYPHEMSGGMRQRVALAQALIMKPEIILLDEPFGALDEGTREDLQKLLLALHDENAEDLRKNRRPSHTLIIVTHELNEALLVGDRVVGLSQFWDWKAERHDRCPGATIIYDKPSPIFKPANARELEAFARQREELRHVVFEPPTPCTRYQHVLPSPDSQPATPTPR